LKVLLVNLLAALNFASVFLKIKKRLENKKRQKRKKRDQNLKKNVKTFLRPWCWLAQYWLCSVPVSHKPEF